MVGTLARVIVGFILACLTAGLIQALFLPSTYDLITSADGALAGSRVLERVFLVATHSAIFACMFALIAVVIGEWMGIRSLPYYLLAGASIALLGFAAQFSSEVPGQPTFFNNHALKALLTAGFFAGLVYWLVAGRGKADHVYASAARDVETSGIPAPKSWKDRPRIIVEDSTRATPGDAKPAKHTTLAERLAEPSKPDDKPAIKPDARPEAKVEPEKSPVEKPVAENKSAAQTEPPVTAAPLVPLAPQPATNGAEAQNETPEKGS